MAARYCAPSPGQWALGASVIRCAAVWCLGLQNALPDPKSSAFIPGLCPILCPTSIANRGQRVQSGR